jgi:hypothetical protein
VFLARQELNFYLLLSRVRRLYKTGIGLITGFIKHSYNMCLHLQFTVIHTHTNLLSPGAVSPVVTSQRRCSLTSRVPQLRSSGLISHDDGSLTQLTQLSDFGQSQSQSESESRYDRRSAGQSVLVSSPVWGS